MNVLDLFFSRFKIDLPFLAYFFLIFNTVFFLEFCFNNAYLSAVIPFM
jgi:hypothetical protein